MKRSSKKEEQPDTQRHQNYSIASSSSTKIPFIRETTLTHFRRQKPLIELPKIFPIHNNIKHKRYLESCYI